MKSYSIFILTALILSVFTGCSGESADLQARLGQESSLAIGQKVSIENKDLCIEFVDVIEDSRCPRNVTCIWQGQAVCSLTITSGQHVDNLNVTVPGLTDDYSEVIYGKYILSFFLIPYPESPAEISKNDYLLNIVCDPLKTPVETEADFTGFITDIQLVGENDIIGRISVESHADKIVDKYIITISTQTSIFRQAGEELVNAPFQTLENKQWVKLWFEGPIMESFPMQATASQIVIIE